MSRPLSKWTKLAKGYSLSPLPALPLSPALTLALLPLLLLTPAPSLVQRLPLARPRSASVLPAPQNGLGQSKTVPKQQHNRSGGDGHSTKPSGPSLLCTATRGPVFARYPYPLSLCHTFQAKGNLAEGGCEWGSAWGSAWGSVWGSGRLGCWSCWTDGPQA